VLGVFLVGGAVPRAGYFFHIHAGGEHFHVHDESGEAIDEHGHDDADHHDHDVLHPYGRSGADEVQIEAPDPVARGHWHTQSPFHRVAPTASVTLATSVRVSPVISARPSQHLNRDRAPRRARGPPLRAAV
jgi:hypothetical protein